MPIIDGAAAIAGLQPTSECYNDLTAELRKPSSAHSRPHREPGEHNDSFIATTTAPYVRQRPRSPPRTESVQCRIGIVLAMLYLAIFRALLSDLNLDYIRKVPSGNAEDASSEGTSSSNTSFET